MQQKNIYFIKPKLKDNRFFGFRHTKDKTHFVCGFTQKKDAQNVIKKVNLEYPYITIPQDKKKREIDNGIFCKTYLFFYFDKTKYNEYKVEVQQPFLQNFIFDQALDMLMTKNIGLTILRDTIDENDNFIVLNGDLLYPCELPSIQKNNLQNLWEK